MSKALPVQQCPEKLLILSESYKLEDKSDRATIEQVLDPRTRMILFKLLSRGVVEEICGCVSTGKEANVYYATSCQDGQPADCAVKIYKTSILLFKDRDKYVTGEYRFRHGYARHNPRKMVRTWAEKEMRNLTRIYGSGVPCPVPVVLKSHILVMSFLGNDGWPAPKLKDTSLSEEKYEELYLQCIRDIRTIYRVCRLVHADLSEFNLLYFNGRCYVIDVSQSVEHDHPHALEFLRKDCTNITAFFQKKGVCVLSLRQLFDFVTDPNVADDNIDLYLDKALSIASERIVSGVSEEHKVDEEVFRHSYIPRTLNEVVDIERDLHEAQEGRRAEIFYQTLTGLKPDLSGAQQVPALLDELPPEATETMCDDISVEGDRESSSEDNEDDNTQASSVILKQLEEEQQVNKKEHKKLVKEANRERRKHKMPKNVKKQKEKESKQTHSKSSRRP
ncbi:serine/threonine-protein kinase RIO1-like isoform X2 [Corticium candelabrum]|uniref:serine/threonine-protein kinase RIO1-like isoform X2 n=1 Tax=Corticium candelabrum TaxID=121492 RepID=UPI002E26DFA2|nr:serine/threonine-protein kinase RIO1-like isoform X2 [Corticium candelabrum]